MLIDFWAYSCINCLRTLPYIKAWDERYRDQGLVVVGIHVPQFSFEGDTDNVQKALTRFGITYPVVQDNGKLLWSSFGNHYWPAFYLMNREGKVVYTHYGEGEYERTENNIRALLGAKGDWAVVKEPVEGPYIPRSMETYMGTNQGERFDSLPPSSNEEIIYVFPKELHPDGWGLQGKWQRYGDAAVAHEKNASLEIRFHGGKAYAVMGSETGQPISVRVLYNGAPTDKVGKDVKKGAVWVQDYRLYELLDLKSVEEGMLEIQTDDPGLQIYSVSFGTSKPDVPNPQTAPE